jgi:zinc transport system substrate-binding protein
LTLYAIYYIITNANELQLERKALMRKKMLVLFEIMLLLILASGIIIKLTVSQGGRAANPDKKLQIVASFYPVYMIGLNLTDQIDSIEINSLTELNTGCLHDYQLTTQDMKLIANADIMIINGGGMEGFLEDIIANYPELTIVDASMGITMLHNEEEHDHDAEFSEHEAEEYSETHKSGKEQEEAYALHDHGEWNAHVWLNPKLYIQQIENVKEGIATYIKKKKPEALALLQALERNSQSYIEQINELDTELTQLVEKLNAENGQAGEKRKAVIFHDAFAYLADSAGIEIAHAIALDSDTALSAGEIADIINEVKAENINYLFTEEQYSDSIARQIEAETAAKVYIIDSAVTGDGSRTSYLNAMRKNIETLRNALQERR